MNNQKEIVIFGIGPISKTIHYASRKNDKFNICCFTADREYIKEGTLCGLPVIPFEEIAEKYPPHKFNMLVVVSVATGTMSRKGVFLRARQKGYRFVNYIDERADVVEDVTMGQNNIIMANTHIGPTGIMGDNNFIRENLYLGHDFNIGDHNFLGMGCIFGGSCHIGNLNFVGMGTTVINDVEIKDRNLIGAGSLVLKNVDEGGKYVGRPAKRIGNYI